MTTTLEQPSTDVDHWSNRRIEQLSVRTPKSTLEHLHKQGIDTIGKLSDALNDGRDIGLGARNEEYRGAIEDLARDEAIESPADGDPDDEAAADAAALAAESDGEHSDEAGAVDEESVEGPAMEAKEEVKKKAPPPEIADDRLEDIYTAHRRVMNAAVRMNRAKAAYKTAKDEYDEAMIELQAVILGSNQPTLFDKPKEKAEKIAPVAQSTGDTVAKQQQIDNTNQSQSSSQAVEDCWKQFPLDRWKQWGITDGILGKLAEASPPILTVGDLNAYTAPKGNGYTPKLTDIAGIGKAAAQKIEDAGIEFWKWWPSNRDAFAMEKGINGQSTEAGGDAGNEATPSEWAEPGVNGRAEK